MLYQGRTKSLLVDLKQTDKKIFCLVLKLMKYVAVLKNMQFNEISLIKLEIQISNKNSRYLLLHIKARFQYFVKNRAYFI